MSAGSDDPFTPADGTLAPPMRNGEVLFEAPWQGRVFGMARAMTAAGLFEWDEFRACLIDELAGREASAAAPFAYYEHFLRALEVVLASKNLLPAEVLRERIEAFERRPQGHDHPHHHHGAVPGA